MVQGPHIWNRAPFIRLFASLSIGILLQWHVQLPFILLLIAFLVCVTAIVVYSFFPLGLKFRLASLNGIVINVFLMLCGALLAWSKDIRHKSYWLGKQYSDSCYVIATLREPLVEKTNSYKALSSVDYVYKSGICKKLRGQVIIYFARKPLNRLPGYGSTIIFKKRLQEIKNSGNPGSFDYKRYSLFQGTTHQVYLTAADFKIIAENKTFPDKALFSCRDWVLQTLRKFIHGEKEQGLAEALLIGYKDDLDKNLVQSYSNTGVIHVIAISGLHLGLIYWLLLLLTRPLKRHKTLGWLRLIVIIFSLWLFSFLAGGQPSVLRSAVMFTCLALGEVLSRKTSIYNTLALSACVLLCINPYWLWDVGFQLSYMAVLSIIMFFKPLYHCWYLSNKGLDFIWKLSAVTIAAQLLTLPVSIYHFHQAPTLFLFTNMVAVPVSSLILIAEIALCAFSFIEPAGAILGHAVTWLISFMNQYIERLDRVSFSTWNGLTITLAQTCLLISLTLAFCFWLMEKQRILLWISAICLLAFTGIHSYFLLDSGQQNKLIVYNVPKYPAMDIVVNGTYSFIGDTGLLADEFARNFHLQPSRILYRLVPDQKIPLNAKDFDLGAKHISIIDSTIKFLALDRKQKIDLLILSRNPRLYMTRLLRSFSIGQVVIDGSVPPWKAKRWKQDCDSLQLPCHDVAEKGAFVMNF